MTGKYGLELMSLYWVRNARQAPGSPEYFSRGRRHGSGPGFGGGAGITIETRGGGRRGAQGDLGKRSADPSCSPRVTGAVGSASPDDFGPTAPLVAPAQRGLGSGLLGPFWSERTVTYLTGTQTRTEMFGKRAKTLRYNLRYNLRMTVVLRRLRETHPWTTLSYTFSMLSAL